MSTPIPEFRGLPQEDVDEFLKKFKTAPVTFRNDELKCLALQKCLTGAAHTWAKNSLKEVLREGDWRSAKKRLLERFSEPNKELRHLERLTKMRFDENLMTLTSYTESYEEAYKKAHKGAESGHIIRGLSRNLLSNIIKHLNILSDNWDQSLDRYESYELIKRIDSRIIPYERREDPIKQNDALESLSRAIKELKESMTKKEVDCSNSKKTTNEVSCALIRSNNRYKSDERYRYRSYGQRPYEHSSGQTKRELPSRSQYHEGQEKPPKIGLKLMESCEKIYGRPPYLCKLCDGRHFHRHCPFYNLNEKGQLDREALGSPRT